MVKGPEYRSGPYSSISSKNLYEGTAAGKGDYYIIISIRYIIHSF